MGEQVGECVRTAVDEDRANGVCARDVVGEVDSEELLRGRKGNGRKGKGRAEEGNRRSDG